MPVWAPGTKKVNGPAPFHGLTLQLLSGFLITFDDMAPRASEKTRFSHTIMKRIANIPALLQPERPEFLKMLYTLWISLVYTIRKSSKTNIGPAPYERIDSIIEPVNPRASICPKASSVHQFAIAIVRSERKD